MSPFDTATVTSAIKAFMHAIAEATALTADGIVGPEVNELVAHAGELLDIVDEQLRNLDRSTHGEAFALAARMRESLMKLEATIGADDSDSPRQLH